MATHDLRFPEQDPLPRPGAERPDRRIGGAGAGVRPGHMGGAEAGLRHPGCRLQGLCGVRRALPADDGGAAGVRGASPALCLRLRRT
ncbi:MAG: hypothetical protein WDN45_11395 [Caulobacteraceae bacterium]